MLYYHTILRKHPNLSPSGFCVLYLISERILGRRQNQTVYTTKELSWVLGLSNRQVQRCIAELRSECLLIYIGKLSTKNIYRLPDELYYDLIHKPSRRKARAP